MDFNIEYLQSRIKNLEFENRFLENMVFGLNKASIVAITDKRGTITFVNEKFCEITGYSKEELIGSNHRIIKSGKHQKELYRDLWNTILNGKVWHGEICNRKKEGGFYWVDSTIIPILSIDMEPNYLAIRFDITDRKLAEQKLIHSSKMISIGEISSGLAHEIKNPLAIINGLADRIAKIAAPIENGSDKFILSIQKIKEMSARISKIVDGLIAFSQKEDPEQFLNISLKDLVMGTLNSNIKNLQESYINLKIDPIPDAQVYCNTFQISQVINHLIKNSIEALENVENKWIQISAVVTEYKNFQFKIIDNGHGISNEIIDKIMQPFFTTKKAGINSGLGLSISQGIINSHGGSLFVEVNSNPTSIYFEIPINKIVQSD